MLYKFTSLVYSNAKGNIQIMKVGCSAPCAPAIAASIRNPDYRPPYSYWLARPISMSLRVQARSVSRLLYGTFIVN